MADNNTLPFEVTKLDHQIEHQPEAKDLWVDVEVKILGKGPSPLEFSFSNSVNEFIWEDDDCPGKIALYEFFVHDAEMDAYDAQFLLIDMILYVCDKLQPVDDNFKGVFSLMLEVKLKPVELNHAGSEKNYDDEDEKATDPK